MQIPLIQFRGVRRTGSMALALLAAGLMYAGPAPGASITVDEAIDDDPAVDNGFCSLREAVIAANTNTGVDSCIAGEAAATAVDKIVFESSLDGTPVVLAIAGTGEDAAMTGDLDILEDVNIIGNGGLSTGFFGGSFAANTLVNADGIDRVIDIAGTDTTVLIEQMAVAGGAGVAEGGGIRTAGSSALTLRNALVAENVAEGGATVRGGGVFAAGDLILENSAVINNAASATALEEATGGGIAAIADLTLQQSVVINNQSETENNVARAGGINFDSAGTLDIDETLILDNSVRSSMAVGGGFPLANGGGLRLLGAGNAEIRRSLIADNTVQSAGGDTAVGAGMSVDLPLSIANSTIGGNDAESDTGTAEGGGLRVTSGGDVTLNNVSLPGNTAVSGTAANGVAAGILNDGGAVTMGNTALVGNTDSSGDSPDCSGPITSANYNILGNNTGCTFTAMANDQVGDVAGGGSAIAAADVFVAAGLEDNGGGFMVGADVVPNFTVALSASSLALDAADPNEPGSGGTCETGDQRGESRPQDGDGDGAAVCDIGAFEQAAAGGGLGGGDDDDDGGCAMGAGSGAVDPLLPLLLLLSIVYLATRPRRQHCFTRI